MYFSISWIGKFLSAISSYNYSFNRIQEMNISQKKRALEEYNSKIRKIHSSFEPEAPTISALDKLVTSKTSSQAKVFDDHQIELEKIEQEKKSRIRLLEESVLQSYPPTEIEQELKNIWSREPYLRDYRCLSRSEADGFIRIGDFIATLTDLFGSDCDLSFLKCKYPFFIDQNTSLRIPCILSLFEGEFNLIYQNDDKDIALIRVRALIQRLFLQLPPGGVQFMFFDPTGLGNAFSIFERLGDGNDFTKQRLIGGKCAIKQDEIRRKLEDIRQQITRINADCLRDDEDETLATYNNGCADPEPYRILVLRDFPSELGEEELKILQQIVTGGKKCGVHVILIPSNQALSSEMDPKHKILVDSILNDTYFRQIGNMQLFTRFITERREGDKTCYQMKVNYCNFDKGRAFDKLCDELRNLSKRSFYLANFDQLVSQQIREKKPFIEIPVGVYGGKNIRWFTLGDSGMQHALILGLIRIGKSNLLDTIILEAIQRYTPDEVVFYLIDQNLGTTFPIYSKYRLPSIKAVALDNDPVYGLYILQMVREEYKERARLFSKEYLDKIDEYNKKPNVKKLPHVILCIDDFTSLMTNDSIRDDVYHIIHDLIKNAGKYGIHIIFSSQNFKNVDSRLDKVYDNMATRFVFHSDNTESGALLEDPSQAQSFTLDDVGKAIFNSSCGDRLRNSLIIIPEVLGIEKESILRRMSEQYHSFLKSSYETIILTPDIIRQFHHPFNRFPNISETIVSSYMIGQSIELKKELNIPLDDNLLLICQKTSIREDLAIFSILSVCIRHKLCDNKEPSFPPVLFVCKGIHQLGRRLRKLLDLLPKYIRILTVTDKSIVDELKSIYKMNVENTVKTTLFIYDFESISNLFEMDTEQQLPSFLEDSSNNIPVVLFNDSIRGIHDGNSTELSYYKNKVGVGLADEEAQLFGCPTATSELDAYYIDIDRSDICSFRFFTCSDLEWIESICEKIIDKENLL